MPAIGTVPEIEIDAEMIAAGTRALKLYDERFLSPEEGLENILRAIFGTKSGERYFLRFTPDALAML